MKNEFVLITGATSGIGKSLAYNFAKYYKYNVFLLARNEKNLSQLASYLEKNFQINCCFLSVDLTQNDSINEIKEFIINSKIDISILVNNAAMMSNSMNFIESSDIYIKNTINLNITNLTKLTYELIDFFIKRGSGKILNVSSVIGFYSVPQSSIYGASKSYLISFSEALRNEIAEKNIQVSCLCPGATKSKSSKLFDFEKVNNIKLKKKFTFSFAGIMDPDIVAKYAIRKFFKNKAIIIPGIMNKLITYIMIIIGPLGRKLLISFRKLI